MPPQPILCAYRFYLVAAEVYVCRALAYRSDMLVGRHIPSVGKLADGGPSLKAKSTAYPFLPVISSRMNGIQGLPLKLVIPTPVFAPVTNNIQFLGVDSMKSASPGLSVAIPVIVIPVLVSSLSSYPLLLRLSFAICLILL